jgi:hypothetical protein
MLTEHFASPVGMAFLKAVTTNTAMNMLRHGGLWRVDRCVFADDDFAPSVITDQSGTIQLAKPSADKIENFGTTSVHEDKLGTPKQIPGYNRYISVENSSPQPSSTAQCPMPKSRRKHTASGVVLIRTPQKESLNRPNNCLFLGGKGS